MNISHFSSDILVEIFSHVNPRDLFSLKWTCRRFYDLYPQFRMSRLNFSHNEDRPNYLPIKVFEHLLHQFGHTITTIMSYSGGQCKYDINLIAKCCPNLKHLIVPNMDLMLSAKTLIDTFKNLERLQMSIRNLDDFDLHGHLIPNIKELAIHAQLGRMNGCDINAPNLQKVNIASNNFFNFYEFCQNCPNLRSLTLVNGLSLRPLELEKAVLCIPNLEALHLYNIRYKLDITAFAKISNLKYFSISAGLFEVDEFLNEICKRDQLVSFRIIELPMKPDTFKVLSQMKNLHTITLHYANFFERLNVRLKQILEAMCDNNFREMQLNVYLYDRKCFDEYTTLLKRSPNLKTLVLTTCIPEEEREKLVLDNPAINIKIHGKPDKLNKRNKKK